MVVAIGASAGGLEAVRGLIAELPALSGIAWILVQHLDPDHPSMLADLLKDGTPFPVVEITDGMPLLPDRLHVIPSGGRIAVSDRALVLIPATKNKGPRLPVDYLLLSLAQQTDLRVLVILLSGNGADGTEGIKAVHAAGGFIIVQSPEEASNDGMPEAAIATGCVDAILPVAAMAGAILSRRNRLPIAASDAADRVAPILAHLKKGGHDFSGYKIGTMQRRIERRARLAGYGADTLAEYIFRLESDPAELQALASDLLINVTEFFRDPDVFANLADRFLPDLVRKHDEARPIRIWCAGCSSGEEAWSLAMLVLEEIARSRPSLKLQLFATDLDADAIATARHGVYPSGIASEVTAERLKRWFIATDEGWRIGPAVQASVVFAVHDLLVDPPFSRIDMIACRNLLIYLQPAAQARAVALFQFALRPGGLLLLGKAEAVSENPGASPPAFALAARKAHIYRRTTSRRAHLAMPTDAAPTFSFQGNPGPAPAWAMPNLPSARLEALEAELASIRSELTDADRYPDANTAEQMAIHADTLSRNQEYQATNEELITSQEELQSLNEELVALNGQLQETIDRQRTTSNDLQNILNSTDVATNFLDLEKNIRFFTPATRALFNMLPGDIGRPFADLSPLTPDPLLAADIATVRESHQALEREIEAADGISYSRRVLPYRTQEQQTEGVIITYTDITDRKRATRTKLDAREVAEAANLAKSRFLAAASHDLRQPLQALGLLRDMLARKTADPESRALLDRFDHTLDSMASMLDGLLDTNRIEAGAVDIAPAIFPLEPQLSETVLGLTVEAAASGLKLRHVATRCHIVSDRRLLAGMIRNLVANALKYTLQGGVLIGARQRGQRVVIEVWDSGIGIAEDQLETVFEPYHQLGPALVDRGRGLGLGLSIVRSLGEMLGHDVSVNSRPGRGSVFRIVVPLAEHEAVAEAAEHAATPDNPVVAPAPAPQPELSRESATEGPHGSRPACILVIDDDAELVDLLGQLLRDDGHRVLPAQCEADAMALLHSEAPQLVISDFLLGGERDGLDLVQAVQESLLLSTGRSIPAIMLTGDISIEALVRLAASDVVRLSKPVRPAELRAAISAALGRPADAPAALSQGQGLVHVIDDDRILLRELGQLLESAGLPARMHDSSEDFRANWKPETAGCLLIDACLPGESGLQLLRSLNAEGHLPPAILITGKGDITMAVEAMKAGAIDFIEKPASGTVIIDSIRRALATDASNATAHAERDAAAARLATLTARQRTVMAMVQRGHASKVIAYDLGLSQRTVENHRAKILQRTRCASLPELARLVMVADPGFVSLP